MSTTSARADAAGEASTTKADERSTPATDTADTPDTARSRRARSRAQRRVWAWMLLLGIGLILLGMREGAALDRYEGATLSFVNR